ncbi:uncharacterized protein KY384_000938 [Bacidia gigantensis]|uniref:uncharacterized protein n=1 Tax=Bacidia gigantensis TaxID=2732470 RepID=UPI001D049347|nr:uncharacterized protein KY384_000938 [Bacidia gigantensis]KAG8534095.1 hypothetical protein KY384_000938 [Bacidia gigantensis]
MRLLKKDAFALLLAAYHPSLDLLGVSTVHGNASLEQTTSNALRILTAIGRPDIPVHPGAAKPFCRAAVHAPGIHGSSGIDGTDLLPEAHVPAIRKPNAVLAMRHAIMDQPADTVSLVATGALTNVALLFATFPETVSHVKGLSIMGGGIGDGFTDAQGLRKGGGNETDWAEFNIYCDPEAAGSILPDELVAKKTTLIPLDLTHQAIATDSIREKLLHGRQSGPPSTLRTLFHDLLTYFARTYSNVFGLKAGPPLHDPLAVAVLLSEEELTINDGEGERWHVEVVTDGVHSARSEEHGQLGRTIASSVSERGTGGIRIPRSFDKARFWDLIDDALTAAEDRLLAQ